MCVQKCISICIFTCYMYINISYTSLFMCAHWHTHHESDLCMHSIKLTRTAMHAYTIVYISERYSRPGPFHAAQAIAYVSCYSDSFWHDASGLAFLCTFDVTFHFAGPHASDSGVWHKFEAAHLQRLPYALLLSHSTRLPPRVVVPVVCECVRVCL